MSPSTRAVTSPSWIPRAAAMLARPLVRQLPRACSRCSAGVGPVLSDQHDRVVGVHGEGLLPLLLGTGAVEVVDGGAVPGAVHPTGVGPELETCQLGVLAHGVERGEERGGVDAVALGLLHGGHGGSSPRGVVSRGGCRVQPGGCRARGEHQCLTFEGLAELDLELHEAGGCGERGQLAGEPEDVPQGVVPRRLVAAEGVGLGFPLQCRGDRVREQLGVAEGIR